jgi:hypothetical protein
LPKMLKRSKWFKSFNKIQIFSINLWAY